MLQSCIEVLLHSRINTFLDPVYKSTLERIPMQVSNLSQVPPSRHSPHGLAISWHAGLLRGLITSMPPKIVRIGDVLVAR